MMNEKDLRDLCNTPIGPYLRPFVANARWKRAQVFLVGTNPATPLRDEFESFSDYWNALTVDTKRFESAYADKHATGASKSTQRSRKLLQQLRPLDVLVTNSMIYPASRPKYIPKKCDQRRIGAQCFDFLVRTCRPKAILFYGSEAVALGEDYFQSELDPYVPMREQPVSAHADVSAFAFPHFSGQGVRRGYRVSEMDTELSVFAKRVKEIFGVA